MRRSVGPILGIELAQNEVLLSWRMEVAFARPGQVPQPNVCMVALVVPMIVFISSMLSCTAAEGLELPDHAYITYGDSWKCERGFKRAEDGCQSIKLPEHAFLSESSWRDGWKCERGFRRVEDECQSIHVPEHAFLTDYGDSWKCERGFKRAEDECQSIQVPEHAFLADYGDSWKCERGFKRADD